MKQSRPFVPTVDKLCTILDVDKPGDLLKVVRELLVRSEALYAFEDSVGTVSREIERARRELKTEGRTTEIIG